MGGQRGRDILLKIDDGASGYETLAGIRTRRIALSAGAVDATNADSPEGWRELIAGAGVKSVRVSGAGVFKDAASDERMRAAFFGNMIETWQLVVPDFGTLTGPFQITVLDWSGAHDGEAEFSVTLESAGAVSFGALS